MSSDHDLFLPVVTSGSSKAHQLADRIKQHADQARPSMLWHDLLASVCYERCKSRAHNNWHSHTDPDGYGPNWWVKQAGYVLPDFYRKTDDGNNIESIAYAGNGVVEDILKAWLDSPGHHMHVFGTIPFYAEQTNYAVGYYYLESSVQKHYWCFISCPPMLSAI